MSLFLFIEDSFDFLGEMVDTIANVTTESIEKAGEIIGDLLE